MKTISFSETESNKSRVRFRCCASLAASSIGIPAGMLFEWNFLAIPKLLDSGIQINDWESPWLLYTQAIGLIIGSITAVSVSGYCGKKKSILLASPLYFSTWSLIAFATSFHVILAAKLLNGVTDGFVFTVTPSYLHDMATTETKGIVCSSLPTQVVAGFLLSQLIGFTFDVHNAALVSSLTPVACFLAFLWMPDTPQSLIKRNKLGKAKNNYVLIYGEVDLRVKFGQIVETILGENGHWNLPVLRSYKQALIVCLFLKVMQQFCGIIAVTTAYATILNQIDQWIFRDWFQVAYFGIQLISIGLSLVLMKKLGIRVLLLASLLANGLIFGIFGLYYYLKGQNEYEAPLFSHLPIAILLIQAAVFGIGLLNIPLLLMMEIFPGNAQVLVLGLGEISSWIGVLTALQLLPYSNRYLGVHWTSFILAIGCLVGLLLVGRVMSERKSEERKTVGIHN